MDDAVSDDPLVTDDAPVWDVEDCADEDCADEDCVDVVCSDSVLTVLVVLCDRSSTLLSGESISAAKVAKIELLIIDLLKLFRNCVNAEPPISFNITIIIITAAHEMLCTAISLHPELVGFRSALPCSVRRGLSPGI